MCTLFRLIFIDLQNVGVISAAACIINSLHVFCKSCLLFVLKHRP